MQAHLEDYINWNKTMFQEEMSKYLRPLDIPVQLKESMLYSVEAGGKMLRPVLLLASYEVYNRDVNKALSTAIALEMIHTYSLIHDDLPAMDNDNYRRGKLTNHKVFDEATAILAGDALLTYSFEIISSDPHLSDSEKVEIIKHLSRASGPKGMVGGQILDMEAENNPVTLSELEEIHTLKTGELLKFAIYSGAYLGNATKEQLYYLNDFAYYLGLIFQVQDDILDVTGDPDKLGKPLGSDEDNQKSTYPKLLGTNGAYDHKQQYVLKAKEALHKASAADSYLMALTDHFSQRDH
ncbi:MAG TPA: farnesyl diphosphate synthase [Virgibacillus sp.]|nr:farnesyl diphosphate synthase [Virgibacillus sp.]